MSRSQLWASVLWAPTFIGVSCIRRDNDKKHMYHLILKRAIQRPGSLTELSNRVRRGKLERWEVMMAARMISAEMIQSSRGMRGLSAIVVATVGIHASATATVAQDADKVKA